MDMKTFLKTPEGRMYRISDWARKLGVSRSYMSQLVSRDRTPSLKIAFDIEDMTKGRVDARHWLTKEARKDGD